MRGNPSPPRIAGPEWPEVPPGRRIVFLVEAASRVERRLVESWIADKRPPASGPATVEVVQIPCPRRQRPTRMGLQRRIPDPALEAALATEGDPLMAPLRIVWLAPLRGGSREGSFLGLLLTGDPRDPHWLRQAIVSRNRLIQVGHVGGVMAVVMDLHRSGVDVRLQGIEGVRQRGQREWGRRGGRSRVAGGKRSEAGGGSSEHGDISQGLATGHVHMNSSG